VKKGIALITVIFVIAAFSVLGALLAKIVYNHYASASNVFARAQAFYLAEAGLEKGKVELAHNPNWFTDPPYYIADSVPWLVHYAVGQRMDLGPGYFKIIRGKGKKYFYSVGYKHKAVVVLKMTFSSPPFTSLKWQEL